MKDNPAAEQYLPAAKVRERYGVSDMSIWRWLHDPALGFPTPTVINKRRYWALSQLRAWELARAVKEAA